MFLIACVALTLVTVPLARGRLGRLADLDLRGTVLVGVALGVQIVVISVVADGDGAWNRWMHEGTYVIGLGFVALNLRRISGLWIVGLGGLCNFVAITVNDGVMPASATALRSAGLVERTGDFANSTTVADARLAFLGDVFSIPSYLPLHNVFSVGDVVIAVGVFVVVHRACASRLSRRLPGAAATIEEREPVDAGKRPKSLSNER